MTGAHRTAKAGPLIIEIDDQAGVRRAALRGELDLWTAGAAAEVLRAPPPPQHLEVDLSGLSFADSAGLTCIAALGDDGTVRFRGARSRHRMILSIIGVDSDDQEAGEAVPA